MLTEESGTSGTDAGNTDAGNTVRPWRDTALSTAERVDALLSRMSLEEKVAQLYGVWVGIDPHGDDVAPHQHDLFDPDLDVSTLIRAGIGQLTRPFGTAAVDPTEGAKALARLQEDIVAANRWSIPALVHEECLTGFMTAGATVFPTPLAWGATFDPEIVGRMAAYIGDAMRKTGVHQGLAPVLDVVRDPRWGRTEESIGEDPYLVGTIGTAYVRALENAGVVATLKHFVGYSASRAARNFGPVSAGPRELADVLLPPFEMAVHEGGARSIMQSYAAIDGVPAAADHRLLTGMLRDTWGFDGTLVSDYNGVSFLELQHKVAGSPAAAAAMALAAGVDVELPSVRCYGEPLLAAVRANDVLEELVDRAARRVLEQKCELGLLDESWSTLPPVLAEGSGADVDVDLDPPNGRKLARTIAERSVVLLANGGALPISTDLRIAIVGPTADEPAAMMGCYAFPNHLPPTATDVQGVPIPTLLDALRTEFGARAVRHEPGCDIDGDDRSGFAAAVRAAEQADVCIAVLGDRSGLFGRGTSGEGCDVAHLGLPGVQPELLEMLLSTGTPVVLVLLTGRPYALGAYSDRLAAVVQGFFPGEEGGPALAGVLSGRVNPSGRLPVSVPRHAHSTPGTYLEPILGQRTDVSTVDPTPLFPFGFGLSYTSFGWTDLRVDGSVAGPTTVTTDGEVAVTVTVQNTGSLAGADVVQLYLHDPVAQVARPVVQLVGYQRVELAPGERCDVTFHVPADIASFTGLEGDRIVEPGEIELRVSRSATDVRHTARVTLTGPQRQVDHTRRYVADTVVTPIATDGERV
jgi:beta-xylosidase